tara:strand:- start:223 stop:708 length:486 start_codon:yes stop_codon:yes gene_type:complete
MDTDCHFHGNGLLCGQENYSSNTQDRIKCFRDLDKEQLSSLLDNYLTVTCKRNKRFNKILENYQARNAILEKIKEKHGYLNEFPDTEIHGSKVAIGKSYLHHFYKIIDNELKNPEFKRQFFPSNFRRIIMSLGSKKKSSSNSKSKKSKPKKSKPKKSKPKK